MARRHWTLLFVSDGSEKVRQVRMPRAVVQLAIAVALVVVSTLSSLGTAFYMKAHAPQAEQALHRQNAAMKRELHEVKGQIVALNSQLEDLAKEDEKFRLVAGLEPISEDVQKVGIGGGPVESKSETLNEVGELLRRAKLLSFSWREARDTLEYKHDRLEATPSIIPTTGYITSAFTRSRMHPILHRARPHQGVDITAPHGTPIHAAAKGRVRFAGRDGDYGLSIEIDHGHGVVTRYAHASKILVKRGQEVTRGDVIGAVGSTGLSVGPHLHYEVLVNGKPTNPRNWFMNLDAIAD
jgi:murein DD-endopeptidase MepM/ murein hydrolase activator NlpD